MSLFGDQDSALVYLDGGPADGTTLTQAVPHWAPLNVIHVEVEGEEVVYVRVDQDAPRPGHPWRYIPQEQLDYTHAVPRSDDPYDD